ncbi:probable 4-coumarate--CoA ligase 1 isoform X3 [Cydia fagiglandana]|uniref:probable 4-coumarate--CoA ligase 1 isoform X3 n=1 Tax=Cydia fagiglandana TaxID=1458189 RepID=UPI002FEE5E89
MPTLPEHPCLLGTLEAGCIASLMNPAYTAHELQHQLAKIDCQAIIASKLSYASIKEALNALKKDIPVILVDNDNLPEGTIKFAEFAEDFNLCTDCLKSVKRGPDDVAILPFSSGTTGFPKGVVLNHRSVVAMNQQIADPEIVVIEETSETHQAVLPAILPFFHIFGFNALMVNQMYLGVKLVTMPYFKPELFLQTLVKYQASVLFLVPPMGKMNQMYLGVKLVTMPYFKPKLFLQTLVKYQASVLLLVPPMGKMNQMYLGVKLVTMPYFKPELFLQTLVKYQASVLFLVPPMGKMNQMYLGVKLVTMPYFKPELFLQTLVKYQASVLLLVPPMGKMNQMYLGVKLVTMPYFKPELFLQTLVKYQASVLLLVPPMVVFLGKHPAVQADHLRSVYGVISGAAPVSEADAAAVLRKNPNINFRQGYGLTETNGGIAIGFNTDANHASVGHVFPSSQVKIADIQTQEALPAGKEGEILYRGPNLMQGYYKDEEATREVFQDGWYKTGDIGKYDDKKYLYVTDRMKELIKVKGFQVAPAELEAIIRTNPKIADCAVLGIPDPVTGEVPKAFIVTQPNQTISPEELKEYVNSKLVSFKHVKEVQSIDAIPKNPAGKILRKDLKAKYC